MIATRRPAFNFALDRAHAWARELELPLVILESLRIDYPYASDRFHRFIIDGMASNAASFSRSPVLYYPYVEPKPGAGRGLIDRLAADAAVVVTDDYPCFFLPQAVAATAARLPVAMEAVDSNGLLPLAAADRAFAAAAHYRRYMQKGLREALMLCPAERPFLRSRLPTIPALPLAVARRWPPASPSLLGGDPKALARLPIDHTVPAVPMRGGAAAARKVLQRFISQRLESYHLAHNHPDMRGTSRLSPYLHFGHISTHEIFDAVMRRERWSVGKLPARANGSRDGWWGVSAGAEAYLDQLLVWRELAYNTTSKRPDDYDDYDSLPAWALKTLADHEDDPRPFLYSRDQFESAATHDRLWNAAQREMRRDGWFHNYMRMLWGKKILEWSATPREALATMIHIMNKWSLDGRDPNSYAGYFWTLGRYDRPWPERAIYGKVRSMSSENTARKVRVRDYLAK
jgi:deoxyribodipyrimidine photo-lyase